MEELDGELEAASVAGWGCQEELASGFLVSSSKRGSRARLMLHTQDSSTLLVRHRPPRVIVSSIAAKVRADFSPSCLQVDLPR